MHALEAEVQPSDVPPSASPAFSHRCCPRTGDATALLDGPIGDDASGDGSFPHASGPAPGRRPAALPGTAHAPQQHRQNRPCTGNPSCGRHCTGRT
eukprot:9363962-Prorocentrum_lima.AAC.1